MADNKPNVIPSKEQMELANQTNEQIATQHIDENNINDNGEVSITESVAAEQMARKTANQIAERERLLKQQEDRATKLDEERLKMMNQQPPSKVPPTPPTPPSSPSGYDGPETPTPKPVDKYASISQPQMNASFDVIPLPSEGKIYKNKKKALKVAYLTAADENILTNPNLMESGEFLEILFNRKILEPDMRYKDLHVGDRNAIMIWLRATGYGHEYPITVYDPETAEPFQHVVDLSELKSKPLLVDTDKDGFIDYILPLTNTPIKFKLLTVGDVDIIESHIQEITDTLGPENVDGITYTLSKQIVEINGNKERGYIDAFIQSMRVGDSAALRKHIDEVESGIDMNLEIRTPGGGSINTFLPLNLQFFWPDL